MNYQTALKEFYARADFEDGYERRWGYGNAVAAEYWQMRDKLVFDALEKSFGENLSKVRVLEIGTGFGHELAKLQRIGLRDENLIGIDFLHNRIQRAHESYPHLRFEVADAAALPFAAGTFDVVMQFTCVMHAFADDVRQAICAEMSRVLRPGGVVIWWDLAPLKWRTLCLRRLLLAVTGAVSVRQAVIYCWETFTEFLSRSRRHSAVQKGYTGNPLLTDVADLGRLFRNLYVKASRAGVDFEIWRALWLANAKLARFTWQSGIFSTHCFATARKPIR